MTQLWLFDCTPRKRFNRGAYNRAWYQANRARIAAASKARYDADPELRRRSVERMAKWRANNLERARATAKRNSQRRWNADLEGNRRRAREAAKKHYAQNAEKIKARNRAWAAANPEKFKANVFKTRLRQYGITPADFDVMVAAQDGRCAICNRATDRWHVDHDHSSNKVRALLCLNCNPGLGQFADDPAKLRRAAEYLDAFNHQSNTGEHSHEAI